LANLRVVLSSLRKELGDFVHIERDQVRINPEAPVRLDTVALEDALEQSRQSGGALTPEGRAFFEKALALYQGIFLEGFYLRGARQFDDWQQIERDRLHALVVQGLQDQVEGCLQSGKYRLGLTLVRRLLELEPLMEAAHHQAVRLLAYSGQREAALDQYELYAERLQSELGVDPAHEMQALYEQLLKGELIGGHAVAGEMQREPRAVGACPYRGLAAFREADANFFFGREDFNELLLEMVHSQGLVTVIVGPSGAGKSSVVYAGLLPRLRAADWLILPFRPGGLPFLSLAGAVLPYLEPDLSETERLVERSKLAKAWRSGELGLIPVLERVAQKQQLAGHLLLVADQFEELFTLCPTREAQHRFLDLLLEVSAGTNGTHSPDRFGALITLRADFMGLSLAHRPFADALQEGVLILGPMKREELRAAIEKPAEMQGVGIEAGLVGRILDDVGEEPGNLPLLEFTLTLLWQRLEQGWMTHAAYESLGGVQGALARYADEVHAELEPPDQERLRTIMTQLVQPGQGTEDTRRIGNRDEFEERDWDLIQLLAGQRLVTTGRGEDGVETVEVIHEALIQRWGCLREWMAADRDFRNWQEGLRAAMRNWETSHRDPGGLLRGVPLLNAEQWLAQRGQDLSPAENEYLQASLAERQARQAREKAQQEHQRDLERRSIQRLRLIVAVLVAASIIGISLTLAVFNQNQIARRNEALAFSRELAAAALNSQAQDQELAVMLAMHALAQADTQEAEQALHQTVADYRLERSLNAPGRSSFIALSPDGRLLISSGEDGAAVWDVNADEILYTVGEGTFISQAAFSPDGSLLVTPNEIEGDPTVGGTISILDAISGEEILTFPAHDTFAQYIAFSPDGTLFASVGGDNHIRVWDVAATLKTGQAQQRLDISDQNIEIFWWVNFSPDGSRLTAAGDGFDGARVWDATSGEVLFSFGSSVSGASYNIFSPDGAYLVSGNPSGLVVVWDAITGKLVSRTYAHTYGVQDILFSPDGTRLASTSNDFVVKVWGFDEGVLLPLMELTGHSNWGLSLAFSPDGKRLYSGSLDGIVKIWDVSPGGSIEPVIYPHADQVNMAVFDPSGDHIATASFDGTAKIWQATSGELLHTLSGHSGWVICLAFSPDGNTLATGGADGKVILWDAATGQKFRTFQAHLYQAESFFKGVRGLAFSPDGQHLASAGVDGAARVWDVASLRNGELAIGDELFTLKGHPEAELNDVIYSPDGMQLAISSSDGTIVIYEASTGRSLWVISDDPPKHYLGITFSSNGRRLAAGDWMMGMSTVWDLPENPAGVPEKSLEIQINQNFVAGLQFSQNGDRLAIAHSDGMGIWDAHTGELLQKFPHPGSVLSAAFSPDEQRLLTAGGDGLARLFYLNVDELLGLVRDRLTRDLTPDECQKYLHMQQCPSD
ncbi:MAG: BTAD domain-containing putative transcriptional regulator, partial [Anaerolineales bacterium]